MPHPEKISSTNRWLVVVAVMSATLMQVLDTTIVNVALPHMQGSLGATSDQISWTLTSYLIASAIFMPLTGYFTDRLGRKNYLLWCIAGFTLTSAICGASQSLTTMVLFRFLQGVFGAALVPLSQAILTDVYPKEELGKAMAIWGIGVMVGPILGPTLGGYLTEISSWRWTFYVNVPIGIMSLLLAWEVVPDTIKKIRKMDWTGFALIALGIGAMQYFLDRGNQEDWFSSNAIFTAAVISILSIVGFIIYSLKTKEQTVFNIRVFGDRNFNLSSAMLFMLSIGLYGASVILPLLLENLLNYSVLTTGLVMAPRGICSMLGMILVGRIIKRVAPHWIIIAGIIISAIGVWSSKSYSLDISPWGIVWPLLIQGFGMGLLFVPLSVLAFSTLPNNLRTEATGLYSLLRTVGSSVGIAITLNLFTRHTQISWNHLSGFIQPYNQHVTQYFQHLYVHLTTQQKIAILGSTIMKQAQMLSFLDVFTFVTWSFLVMLPFVFFLKKQQKTSQ